MATDNIDEIKKQLKNCIQIQLPYNFNTSDKIKYITLKDNSELFYIGGNFVKYGQEKIYLTYGGKQWCFKTKIRDDNNNIKYNTKIFLEKSNREKYIDNTKNELINTIISQKDVIDKLTNMIKQQNAIINKHNKLIEKLKNIN